MRPPPTSGITAPRQSCSRYRLRKKKRAHQRTRFFAFRILSASEERQADQETDQIAPAIAESVGIVGFHSCRQPAVREGDFQTDSKSHVATVVAPCSRYVGPMTPPSIPSSMGLDARCERCPLAAEAANTIAATLRTKCLFIMCVVRTMGMCRPVFGPAVFAAF